MVWCDWEPARWPIATIRPALTPMSPEYQGEPVPSMIWQFVMSISKVDCAGPAEEDKTARGITNEMDAKFRRAMDDEGIIATKPLQDERSQPVSACSDPWLWRRFLICAWLLACLAADGLTAYPSWYEPGFGDPSGADFRLLAESGQYSRAVIPKETFQRYFLGCIEAALSFWLTRVEWFASPVLFYG